MSEWYSWQNDLRNNPDIQILASIDPSSFPVGTDPNQTWYSGYYPIIWTNKNYKMIYANFGHNAMNYETNTRLSSTFDSPAQNQFMMDALKWLGGAGTTPPVDQPSPTAWYTIANKAQRQVRRRPRGRDRQRDRDPAVQLQLHAGTAVPVPAHSPAASPG